LKKFEVRRAHPLGEPLVGGRARQDCVSVGLVDGGGVAVGCAVGVGVGVTPVGVVVELLSPQPDTRTRRVQTIYERRI
jgi:hypothetical protein